MTQNIKYLFSPSVILYFITAFVLQGYTDMPVVGMAVQLHMLWVLSAVLLKSEPLSETFKPWGFVSIVVLSLVYQIGLSIL